MIICAVDARLVMHTTRRMDLLVILAVVCDLLLVATSGDAMPACREVADINIRTWGLRLAKRAI